MWRLRACLAVLVVPPPCTSDPPKLPSGHLCAFPDPSVDPTDGPHPGPGGASPAEPVRRSKFMGLGRWGGEGKSNFRMSDAAGWANLIVGSAPNSSFSSEIHAGPCPLPAEPALDRALSVPAAVPMLGLSYPLDSPANQKKFGNKTKYPQGWVSAIQQSARALKPQVYPKGNVAAIFIGDEGCCYNGCNESNYIAPLTKAIRDGVGGNPGVRPPSNRLRLRLQLRLPGSVRPVRLTVVMAQDPPYIFANECGPWWKDYASPPCCSDASCEGLAYQCQVPRPKSTRLVRCLL